MMIAVKCKNPGCIWKGKVEVGRITGGFKLKDYKCRICSGDLKRDKGICGGSWKNLAMARL